MADKPDYIRLFTAFRNHQLYPKDRPFTDYEAWLDLLIECYPEGTFIFSPDNSFKDTIFFKWGWTRQQAQRFVLRLTDLKLIVFKDGKYEIFKKKSWYAPEAAIENYTKEFAIQVVTSFNQVMERRVSLNPAIERAIKARVREGRTMTPPIGLDQFVAVFKHMRHLWTNEEPDMKKYLELETLCGTKFFKYLEKARQAHREKGNTTFNAFTTRPR